MFCPSTGLAYCPFISWQTALKETYGHVTTLMEVAGQEGVNLVLKMERTCPQPAIKSVALCPLRRLYTPKARIVILGFLPKDAMNTKLFN